MTVRQLIHLLHRYDPDARLCLAIRGHLHPEPAVGVAVDGRHHPCVVLVDRAPFPGQLPDLLLARRPPRAS